MKSLVSVLLTIFAITLVSSPTYAQQLQATPKSSKGLFCNLCKIQGCSCNSASTQCVNCGGGLTAKTQKSTAKVNPAQATRKACGDAKGKLANGRCSLR